MIKIKDSQSSIYTFDLELEDQNGKLCIEKIDPLWLYMGIVILHARSMIERGVEHRFAFLDEPVELGLLLNINYHNYRILFDVAKGHRIFEEQLVAEELEEIKLKVALYCQNVALSRGGLVNINLDYSFVR